MKQILFFLFSFLAFLSNAQAKNCQENRLGFDIGSGSTKILVAQVDTCQKKILKVLLQDSRPVSYNEDFEKSKDGTISPVLEEKGLATLKELSDLARIHKPVKSSGIATSVFRKAKNGKDIIQRFSKKLKISLTVISQEKEAELGYASALSAVDQTDILGQKKKVIVWDIGGGSMQMIMKEDNQKFQMYLGQLASVSFKNMIIEIFQQRSIETTLSPNPIGLSRPNAVSLARAYARLHVPTAFVNKERNLIYVGVGGVHNQSIKNQLQLKEMSYTLRDIDDMAVQQAQKSDKDLTGEYRSTDVSNLLLVQGFMEALGIREVLLANTSLLQGLLIEK